MEADAIAAPLGRIDPTSTAPLPPYSRKVNSADDSSSPASGRAPMWPARRWPRSTARAPLLPFSMPQTPCTATWAWSACGCRRGRIQKRCNSGTRATDAPAQSRGVVLVAMVGRMDSPVARAAQCVLDVSVEQEACPHNLAPTTSSATQLAMGDALAMALMAARGFGAGRLCPVPPWRKFGAAPAAPARRPDGRTPAGLHRADRSAPRCAARLVRWAGWGCGGPRGRTPEGRLLGIITDGDLRRALDGPAESSSLTADQLLNADPQQLTPDASAATALDLLESRRMSQIVVCAEDGQFLGFVHLHQLMDAGLR